MKRIQSVILLVLVLLMALPPYVALADTPEEAFINVKDFGAVGDGKTDDRAAILSAFNYAKQHLPATVYFPEGEYGLLTNGLYIRLPHGSGNLTVKGDGKDKSTIVYLKEWETHGEWVGLRIMPELPADAEDSTDYSSLTEDQYIHDVTIKDMGVHDTDPVNHAWHTNKGNPSTEETHGFNIKYCKRAIVQDCKVSNVGDEGIDMNYCIESQIINNTVVTSPGAGAAGGAISVGDGCDGVIVKNNTVTDSIKVKNNFGIAIEALLDPVKNVTVEENIVKDITGNGVNVAAPGSYLENITIKNNEIQNCTQGIATASLGKKINVKFIGNKIENTNTGINVAGEIEGLEIDGCEINKTAECGIRIAGKNTVVKNSIIQNSDKKAIYFVGENAKVEYTKITSVGLTDTSVAAVDQYKEATASLKDVEITNCKNQTAILGVDSVINCTVSQTQEEGYAAIKRVKIVRNSSFDRNVYVTVNSSVIDGVKIKTEQTIGAVPAIYVVNVTGCTVKNCEITIPSGYAITEAGADAANNTVCDNIANGGYGFLQKSKTSTFINNKLYCYEHTFGEFVYNGDATHESNGTKTRTCKKCSATETVVAEGTMLPDPSQEHIVNVKDFGAVGDGKTDDRAAILSAFNYAKQHLPATVYFPEGEYGLLTNGLYIRLPHGSGNLTVKGDGKDKSTIVYLKEWETHGEWVGLRIMPELPADAEDSTDYSSLTEDQYIHDVTIKDMGVHDTDPVNHAWHTNKGNPSTEETHGFNIKYCKRAIVQDCKVSNVGDEGIDMNYCIESQIINNTVVTSPGAGAAGGAISVGDGCDGVIVKNNTVTDSIKVKNNFGIAIEALLDPVKNVTVEENIVKDITGNGVNVAAPGSYLENITIKNNEIQNCTQGIATASLGKKINVKFIGNKIENTNTGINVAGEIEGLEIDGCEINKTAECGIRIAGKNTVVKNSIIQNSDKKAIYFVGENAKVEYTKITSVGLTDTSVAAVDQYKEATASLKDVEITNCKNQTAILGVDSVINCTVSQTQEEGYAAIKRVKIVRNSSFDRNVYVTVNSSVIDGVKIKTEQTIGAVPAIYVVNVTGCTVKNCEITIPSGYAITEAGADAANNTVKNNVAHGGKGFIKKAESSVFENNILYCLQHSFGEYVYNNDAFAGIDGTKTRTCKNCPATETVVAEGTALPDGIVWEFDETEGTLTIKGIGPMDPCEPRETPWYDISDRITKIVVEEGIQEISNWVFSYCYNVKEIVLPDTLEKIGSNAFYVCYALETIEIPENVSFIGGGAFYKCRNLKNINIPQAVTKINTCTFDGCTALANIYYPGKLTEFNKITVGNYNEPFLNASVFCNGDVKSWSFDETSGTLTFVGTGAMEDYTPRTSPWYDISANIKKIVIGEGITSIGNWAFAYCYNAQEVELPKSLTHIGSSAFYNCYALKNITIPESVSTIDGGAFYNCTSLGSINIPVKVKIINSCTFEGCSSLSDIYYSGTLEHWSLVTVKKLNSSLVNEKIHFSDEKITWNFDAETSTLTISGLGKMDNYAPKNTPWYEHADKIKTIIIEEGITSIGNYAFSYLMYARRVEIPSTVESIGAYSFYSNGISSLTVPEKTTSIGSGAFAYCKSLKSVSIPSNVKTIVRYTFTGSDNITTLIGDFTNKTIEIGNEPITNLI